MANVLKNYIAGEWVSSSASQKLDVVNPATGERLADVPLSAAADVDRAVAAAQAAFPSWRETPPIVRARYFFTLKQILEEHFEELARIVTSENGKTLDESRGSVRRAIENVEVAAGIPSLMMGAALEDIGAGIDCVAYRQPLGVFAAIAPFNFPAMVPLWFFPYAVACGNTYIVKPSEQVPLSQTKIFELCAKAGFPPGVLNLVHGAKEVVDRLCTNPGIRGVSFVGSSEVAKVVYQKASEAGKRVQALGGAKNFVVVMPDVDVEKTADAVVASCFGCAGERCLAGSTIVAVGEVYDSFAAAVVKSAKALKMGNGMTEGVTLGPVISARHRDRIMSYISKGIEEGAKLLLDGRDAKVPECPKGHFVGATVFGDVRPEMTIAREEIFGPVACLLRAKSLDDAIDIARAHPLANAASIFTKSGAAARKFQYRIEASMVGVNVGVAAPMSFFPFGGNKGSFFGDLKAHGRDSIEFFTDKKVVISRWN